MRTVTFREHAREALAASSASPGSISGYAGIVKRRLDPALGALPLGAVTPKHVADVLTEARDDGLAPKSVACLLTCLRSILQAGVDWDRIPANPAARFRVKVPKQNFDVLTCDQRDRLDEVLSTEVPWYAGQILRVLLWTGLRVSEALALHPADYDHTTGELEVRESKTDAGVRYVDVPDVADDPLRSLLSSNERPHPTTLRRHLVKACELAGVPKIRVHDLRHTRITTQLRAGVPVSYVSEQAGHSSPGFTLSTYDHWAQEVTPEQRRTWTNAR